MITNTEELRRCVEWAKNRGLIQVRPAPTVCYATMKRRMYDNARKKALRAQAKLSSPAPTVDKTNVVVRNLATQGRRG